MVDAVKFFNPKPIDLPSGLNGFELLQKEGDYTLEEIAVKKQLKLGEKRKLSIEAALYYAKTRPPTVSFEIENYYQIGSGLRVNKETLIRMLSAQANSALLVPYIERLGEFPGYKVTFVYEGHDNPWSSRVPISF